MIVSLNWLKKFVDIEMPIDELATLVGARLVEIEEVVDYGAKYSDVVIAKVISAIKLEGSDHLSVVKIDDGNKVEGLERDAEGLVQVVCGAPNIRAGLTVAWLPPKSIVPESFEKNEQFVLDVRTIRNVLSNGMIASAKELAISDDHEGVIELDDNCMAGDSFAKFLELDDHLIDIENKSLTHRPDCFGVVGIAREIAAISKKPFKTESWLLQAPSDGVFPDELELSAIIEDEALCSRYMAVAMKVADKSLKSPLINQSYLSRVGVRPISAIVDVTNYLMLVTGQPLHAFDYDKVAALNGGKVEIHVRAGREGEELKLLDGKTIKLSTDDVVIASGQTAIGLAGAMGGANSEIDENTKNIIIESASFNLYKLRATQMRHGIFSEAITRFTKGQPAELSSKVIMKAVDLMKEWAGAETSSKLVDEYPSRSLNVPIKAKLSDINGLLGSNFSKEEIVQTLKNIEFNIVEINDDELEITAPYWRTDIHIIEDIIEEVGRINGFDNINPVLPSRDFTAVMPSGFDEFRKVIRKTLVRAGANEMLTYSFIHGDVLRKTNQEKTNSYQIINSISPDLQYYRQSLTSSLLGLVNMNARHDYDEFALFELNKVHHKNDGLDSDNVPIEREKLALVYSNKDNGNGSPYYVAKRFLDFLSGILSVKLHYGKLKDLSDPVFYAFEQKRSAALLDEAGNTLGVIGEYKKSIRKEFKLSDYCSGFELDLKRLYEIYKDSSIEYRPISKFPGSYRDVCFKVSRDTNYDQIIMAAESAELENSIKSEICPIDIYQQNGSDSKNVTIRIKIVSFDKTLTSQELNSIVDVLSQKVVETVHAVVV